MDKTFLESLIPESEKDFFIMNEDKRVQVKREVMKLKPQEYSGKRKILAEKIAFILQNDGLTFEDLLDIIFDNIKPASADEIIKVLDKFFSKKDKEKWKNTKGESMEEREEEENEEEPSDEGE